MDTVLRIAVSGLGACMREIHRLWKDARRRALKRWDDPQRMAIGCREAHLEDFEHAWLRRAGFLENGAVDSTEHCD